MCGRLQVHWSCRSGDANKLSSLIDAGYNLKIKNKKGETGLHIACFSGSNACCEVRPHGAPFPVSDVLSPMLRCATGGQRPARVQGLASLHAVIRDAFRANYSPLRFLSSLSTLSLSPERSLPQAANFLPKILTCWMWTAGARCTGQLSRTICIVSGSCLCTGCVRE